MSNPIVRCTVDQCTHYMPGDQCMAAKISVFNDKTKAVSSAVGDTECESFRARKSITDMIGAFHNANIGGTISAAFLPGTQITPSVECFVDNCKHWNQGNMCSARNIDVHGINASTESDTTCSTFEPI
ncbi:DUF1540 domain-containing protein [Selenomonadales bacterium OttesenSCG-928-I06]|nr:DUF1540 domain-containing protein [Selenomonadales bacterium OttesenSCG-928-I06]